MNEFCKMKGIWREFSVARTPQQNGVAERKNKTLIEATRTMLADSKLPTTFWAETVNTACYVQNRVLVIKPHNKTPYELFLGKKPALRFMRPFGCPVTILNTLDHLDKFDGKSNDGFFVGYSINRNQTNGNAGTKENIDVGQAGKKTVPGPQYVLLPFFTFDSQGSKSSEDEVVNDAGQKNRVLDPAKVGDKNGQEKDVIDQEEALRKQFKQEFERLSGQWKATNTNNTNRLNTVSSSINADANGNSIYKMFTPVSAAGSSYDNLVGLIPVNAATLPNADLPTDPLMPDLEDIVDLQVTGIFNGSYDDEVESKVVDFNNLELTILHQKAEENQPQGLSELLIYLFSLTNRTQEGDTSFDRSKLDRSWIEAMQDELLPFILQKVWRLVDLPKGKHAIGTKWVYRNKKDERGIVVRNKARLVALGYTQEEGINYDKVFAPVAGIKAIRLFLAYASFMGFIVYQMDVKSAFLYGIIEEEVYVCQPPGFEDP
ncbi:putative ribonuclease H-like domain-containing protein [Tanacetum coccineum]